jgi:hypothetical protein
MFLRKNGRERAEEEALSDFQEVRTLHEQAQAMHQEAERVEGKTKERMTTLSRELRRISER